MRKKRLVHLVTAIALLIWAALPAFTHAKESIQQWELIIPEGVVRIEPMQVNTHPSSLEGKTVMLRWNGKHNGDLFLERVGELIAEKVKDVKVVKSWEVSLATADISQNENRSKDFIKKLMESKPDIVIGSQCD